MAGITARLSAGALHLLATGGGTLIMVKRSLATWS
jgi:hypothetical protein